MKEVQLQRAEVLHTILKPSVFHTDINKTLNICQQLAASQTEASEFTSQQSDTPWTQ